MKMLDSIGINCFCCLSWKNISCEDLSLFFCLFALCSASVNALQIVFSNSSNESTAKWKTCQIFKEDSLLVHV